VLLCRFHTFFKILRMVVAGFGENCTVFLRSPFVDWVFYPDAFFFFYYIVVFVTFLTVVAAIVFLRSSGVLIANLFLEIIIIHVFDFLFLPVDDWPTSENRRILVEGTISWEFCLSFLSVKPRWVLMDGWMQEWRRVMSMSYLAHNMGK
jgi:hypothetical protein